MGESKRLILLNVLDRWRKFFIQEKRRYQYVTSAGVGVKGYWLKSFLNLLEKLINSSGRSLVDHTISQRQKGFSFLCYFLAGIGNKHISSLKKILRCF